ncbi:hypothetical protein MYX76_09290 [Desulfobacterota bacterium AH_259_B03_O07]|nr:hypothetical protein [Desulfobacterota bacterium AH_259_B03_O07]
MAKLGFAVGVPIGPGYYVFCICFPDDCIGNLWIVVKAARRFKRVIERGRSLIVMRYRIGKELK